MCRLRIQPASVRGTLIWLVLACLLPGMATSAAMLYLSFRSERAQLVRDTVQTARALVQAVDRDLLKAEAAAQALSTSGYLMTGNLAAFHAQATDLLRKSEIGNNVVLSDGTGQQLVNTLRPFPGPLPRHGNPGQLQRVFETARPVISDIYVGGVLHRPVMSVDVPVIRDGRVVYSVSIGLFPERFAGLLATPQLPADWVIAVFDTQGVVASRSHAPEKFIGKKGSPKFIQRMAEVREDVVEAPTLEGIPTVAIFSRSPATNWSVGIGIPVDTFETPLRRRFLLFAAAIATLLAVGAGLASIFAERIAHSIRALIAPALALGAGEAVAVPHVPLREAGEVAAAIGTAGDLLSRRTHELEAANRELQEFSYAVSHDLNAPLRAISGFARIIRDEHGRQLDNEGQRLLGRVSDSAERMGRLIDGLTEFMQISRRKLDPGWADIGNLAGEVFSELSARAPGRNVELRVGSVPPAWGDSTLLRRAMVSLIANAMKFIPADAAGRIEISGEIAGGECIYHVADNGVGFDQRYADKLFQVFERVHAPGQFEGVGIGLALVKRILGRHGGRAWAEGRVGQGATFHFALPVHQPAA